MQATAFQLSLPWGGGHPGGSVACASQPSTVDFALQKRSVEYGVARQ